MAFGTVRFLEESDVNQLDTAQQVPLGAEGVIADSNRRYRYVKFGGTSTINAGLLVVTPAITANSTHLLVSAAVAVGATSVTVTNGVTSVTQDQFADGYLDVEDGTSYRIVGNTAAGNGGTITVLLGEPVRIALTTSSRVALAASPYSAVTASLTLANPVGVTVTSVPNTSTVTNYGWVQVGGHVNTSATSGTKGQPATQDLAGTAGFTANTGAGAAETSPAIGIFKESAQNSVAPVELNLP